MKTRTFELNKRKFFLTGLLALFSLKLAKFTGADKAMAKETSSKSTEDRLATLEHELTRLQDVNEIMKLQARYEAIHATDENLGWMLFADRPDTSKEITAEKIIGFENIKGGGAPGGGAPPQGGMPEGTGGPPSGGAPSGAPGGQGGQQSPAGAPGGAPPQGGIPGGTGGDRMAGIPAELQRYYEISTQGHKFTVHPVSTPCIEVAADGKTAKGTYTSLGFEGDMWCFGKYANDYIKIDGKWYIWHMKWLRCFKAPYEIGWADQTLEQIYEFTKGEKDADGNPKLNPEVNYDYLLAPNKPFKTITVAKPYETWTEEDENGGWWKRKTIEP